MDKIYSRKRLLIPKFKGFGKGGSGVSNSNDNRNLDKILNRKLVKTVIIVAIGFFIANRIISTIEPTMDILCVDMAKSIATKISNEQATVVMRKLPV